MNEQLKHFIESNTPQVEAEMFALVEKKLMHRPI